MDNFKCLTFFYCDDLNKKNTIVLVDLFEACERNLQDFSLSQKIGVIPQIHCFSWIFTYKAEDLCYMGEKRFSKVSVADLSLI